LSIKRTRLSQHSSGRKAKLMIKICLWPVSFCMGFCRPSRWEQSKSTIISSADRCKPSAPSETRTLSSEYPSILSGHRRRSTGYGHPNQSTSSISSIRYPTSQQDTKNSYRTMD
jgi:hypothetical protein